MWLQIKEHRCSPLVAVCFISAHMRSREDFLSQPPGNRLVWTLGVNERFGCDSTPYLQCHPNIDGAKLLSSNMWTEIEAQPLDCSQPPHINTESPDHETRRICKVCDLRWSSPSLGFTLTKRQPISIQTPDFWTTVWTSVGQQLHSLWLEHHRYGLYFT